MFVEFPIEQPQSDPGLGSYSACRWVNFKDLIKMSREVQNERMTNSLSCKAAAVAARENRHAVFSCNLNCSRDFICVARDGNPDRHHLVYAGVGAVQ